MGVFVGVVTSFFVGVGVGATHLSSLFVMSPVQHFFPVVIRFPAPIHTGVGVGVFVGVAVGFFVGVGATHLSSLFVTSPVQHFFPVVMRYPAPIQATVGVGVFGVGVFVGVVTSFFVGVGVGATHLSSVFTTKLPQHFFPVVMRYPAPIQVTVGVGVFVGVGVCPVDVDVAVD